MPKACSTFGEDRLILTDPLGYLAISVAHERGVRRVDGLGRDSGRNDRLEYSLPDLATNTERPVTIEQGGNVLVGTNRDRIIEAGRAALRAPRTSRRRPELWDGHAAERIADALEGLLESKDESTGGGAEPADQHVGSSTSDSLRW